MRYGVLEFVMLRGYTEIWPWGSGISGKTQVCGSGVLCHVQGGTLRYVVLEFFVMLRDTLRYVVLEFFVVFREDAEVCGSGVPCHAQGQY